MDNNDRRKWQGELRRSLERKAFNEKYECLSCGKKEHLHIHHLIYTYSKEDFLNPSYWRILCKNCHALVPKKYKTKLKKIKKPLLIFESRNCKDCGNEFIPKKEDQKFCKRQCQKDYWRKVFHDKPAFNKRLDRVEKELGIK